MATAFAWAGFGCDASNTLPTDGTILTPARCVVTLSQTAGVVKVVQLPAGVRAVRLYSPDHPVSVALDTPPLAPGMSADDEALVDAMAFHDGDLVLQGQWYLLGVPNDALAHTCQLLSSEAYTRVELVALIGS